jgi:ferrous iron transport protein A
MTANNIEIGKTYFIKNLKTSDLSLQLMEMGFLPGKKITMLHKAPLKDPLGFRLENSFFALRIKEAELIEVSE